MGNFTLSKDLQPPDFLQAVNAFQTPGTNNKGEIRIFGKLTPFDLKSQKSMVKFDHTKRSTGLKIPFDHKVGVKNEL